jgi:hypothetical protein
MRVGKDWYTLQEVQALLHQRSAVEREHMDRWLACRLNSAFQKGVQIGMDQVRGERQVGTSHSRG